MIAFAPASQSSVISRSTAGIGARAPSPVSRPGCSARTQPRCWILPDRENTRPTATATVSADRHGSVRQMSSTNTATGPRSSRSGHRSQRGCPPVTAGSRPAPAARGTQRLRQTAGTRRAVPTSTALLQGAQALSALRSNEARRSLGSGVAQRDEQIPGSRSSPPDVSLRMTRSATQRSDVARCTWRESILRGEFTPTRVFTLRHPQCCGSSSTTPWTAGSAGSTSPQVGHSLSFERSWRPRSSRFVAVSAPQPASMPPENLLAPERSDPERGLDWSCCRVACCAS